MPQDPILPPESRKAVHAARDAEYASQVARQVQLEHATEEAAIIAAELADKRFTDKAVDEDRLIQLIHKAVMKGFSFEDTEERRRFIDVTKEKLICQSIVGIDHRLSSIEGNVTWAVRIVIGAVIMALLGLIFIK